MEPDLREGTLNEIERRRARTVVVKKAIRYFEDRNNRSWSQDSLLTRRRNLAVHLGVDESVCKTEVQKINVHSLPLRVSPIQPHESLSRCSRYLCLAEQKNHTILE